MARSLHSVLAGVAAGAVAALVVSTVMNRGRSSAVGSPRIDQEGSEEPSERNDDGQTTRAMGRAISDLNTRVAALQSKGGGAVEATVPRAAAPAQAFASPEEQRVRIEAAHREAIQRHNAEPIDTSWAPKASTAVTSALEKLAIDGAFKLAKVDCRDTSCTADLDWTSLDAASKGYREVLHSDYGAANCTRSILVPDRGDPGQPVSATLVLNNCPKSVSNATKD